MHVRNSRGVFRRHSYGAEQRFNGRTQRVHRDSFIVVVQSCNHDHGLSEVPWVRRVIIEPHALPTILPARITVRPLAIVRTGDPVMPQPWNGVAPALLYWSSFRITIFAFGSTMTRSASDPGSNAPLRG